MNKTRCFAAKQKSWTASKKLRVIAVTSSSKYILIAGWETEWGVYLEKEDYKMWSDIRIVSGLGNIISSLAGEHPSHNTREPEMFWLQWTSSRLYPELFNPGWWWGYATDCLPHLLSISGCIFPDDYDTGDVIAVSSVIWNMPPAQSRLSRVGRAGDSGLKCLSCRHIFISTLCIRVPEVKWFLTETNLSEWRLASASRWKWNVAQDVLITKLPHLIIWQGKVTGK